MILQGKVLVREPSIAHSGIYNTVDRVVMWPDLLIIGYALASFIKRNIDVYDSESKSIFVRYHPVGVPRDELFSNDITSKSINLCFNMRTQDHYDFFNKPAVVATTTTTSTATAAVEELYCVCKKPWDDADDNEMVGCDSKPTCKFGEWYHLICLNINKASLKSNKRWICPECCKK